MMADRGPRQALLLDWGDTLMRVFPECQGPMCSWPEVAAMPHAREVLQQLRPDWRLALVTNAMDSSPEQIELALARVSLSGLIDRIYCHSATGHLKPSGAFFEHVLDDLGIPVSLAVMVGDDYEKDILGASRAGIRAIWLNNADDELREGPLIRTITNLRELPRVLEHPNVADG